MFDALTSSFGPPLITIDVEDWPQSTWDRSLPITQRAADNTQRVLELLDENGVRATMFVLGKFAQKFPEIVREIYRRGHEVASHGLSHVEIFKQSRQEFLEDARTSKDLLEQIVGNSVRGYRAPDFSIVRRSLWALSVLAEIGYEYDSSVFPVRRPRYGIPEWPLDPRRVQLPDGRTIIEFPIATYKALGKNWPVGGGGYHRLLPGIAGRWLVRNVIASVPFVFYCHPYEFDAHEFSEISLRLPWNVRLHQGLGRSRFTSRFRKLLHEFKGQRVVDVVNRYTWPQMSLPV